MGLSQDLSLADDLRLEILDCHQSTTLEFYLRSNDTVCDSWRWSIPTKSSVDVPIPSTSTNSWKTNFQLPSVQCSQSSWKWFRHSEKLWKCTQKTFNIECIQRDADDHTSVHICVEALNALGPQTPVLLYKPQGTEQNEETVSLLPANFTLGL